MFGRNEFAILSIELESILRNLDDENASFSPASIHQSSS